MQNGLFTKPNDFIFIQGPCALESHAQMQAFIEGSGHPRFVRAGTFKMRTNKESFQGLGIESVNIIKELKKQYDFQFVSEVTDPRQLTFLHEIVDVYQVGSRNMYNYELLKELDSHAKPVILKRAFSATIKEWLGAAEYMPHLGENNIILCERGVRTFESSYRNTLDLNAVVYLKKHHPFKVVVDPSHAAGVAHMVSPLAMAAMASGADGLIVEAHPNPYLALSDKEQALSLAELNNLKEKLAALSTLMGRHFIQ